MSQPLAHRLVGYALLAGEGLEIGALHEPAPLPARCRVAYFDAIDASEAAGLFPEIDPSRFVTVDHIGDLDRGGLSCFPDNRFDFVVINHVLEHIANPIATILDVFRITKPGGHAVIAVPDKDYTFDRTRPLTPPEHLWREYETGVTEVTDEHYLEFLTFVAPHVLREPPENLPHHLKRARSRREHAHVWTLQSFASLMLEIVRREAQPVRQVYSSIGVANHIECFAIWEKTQDSL
jgi:SAM-dependent methyltransferase